MRSALLALLASACGRIAFDAPPDAPPVDAACETCDDGLVAHWPFDETSGMVARDVVGGFDASMIGQVTWGAGVRGGAVRLARGHGVVAMDLAAVVPTGFTIALWYEPSAASSAFDRYFSSSYLDVSGTHGSIQIDNGQSGNGVRCFPYIPPQRPAVESNGVFPATGWRHVACSFDGSTVAVFANGTRFDTATTTGTMLAQDEPLMLGLGASIYPNGTDVMNEMAGSLDDVRVYNRALTADELTALALR